MPNLWISDVSQGSGEALENVQVCEEQGTRAETFGATSFEANVVLRVPWAKRFEVFWDIYQNNVPYPDAEKCFFASCSISPDMQKPVSSADGVIQYADALLSIKYSTDEAEAQKLYVQTIEPAKEFRVLDKAGFYWGSVSENKRDVTEKEAPGVLHGMYNYTVRWLQQEKVPIEFFNLIGYVNKEEYTITNFAGGSNRIIVQPEGLLFQPGPINKSVWLQLTDPAPTAAADKVPKSGWDYTLKFIVNVARNADTQLNEGIWNKFFNAKVLPMPIKESDWYEHMYRSKTGGPGEVFRPYPLETFPVDDETPSGTRFLPKSP